MKYDRTHHTGSSCRDDAFVSHPGAPLPMPESMDILDIEEKYTKEESKNTIIDTIIQKKNVCVYKYRDKYLDKFSRVSLDDSLIFDSHFESANLHSSYRVVFESSELTPLSSPVAQTLQSYDLYMSFDLNSSGSNLQWFYFKVSNLKAGQVIKFNIKNYRKPNSLFRSGMRPLVYSETEKTWSRNVYNVTYLPTSDSSSSEFQNMLADQHYWNSKGGCNGRASSPTNNGISGNEKFNTNGDGDDVYYTLSFTYDVKIDDDIVYFAYSYPYPYSQLQRYLSEIEADPLRTLFMRRRLLCKTIGGNRCDVLTITAPASSSKELCQRPVVIITGRVHPGESNSSLVIHGFIDYLTRPHCEEARQLRSKYIFKIIPMLNPDSVINGCYRADLTGCDLNRKWMTDHNDSESMYPTLFHTKKMIHRLQRNHSIALLIDIHGHSAQRGIFTYGCLPGRRMARGDCPPIDPLFAPTSSSPIYILSQELAEFPEVLELIATLNSRSVTAIHVQRWRAMLLPSLLGYFSSAFSLSRCRY